MCIAEGMHYCHSCLLSIHTWALARACIIYEYCDKSCITRHDSEKENILLSTTSAPKHAWICMVYAWICRFACMDLHTYEYVWICMLISLLAIRLWLCAELFCGVWDSSISHEPKKEMILREMF